MQEMYTLFYLLLAVGSTLSSKLDNRMLITMAPTILSCCSALYHLGNTPTQQYTLIPNQLIQSTKTLSNSDPKGLDFLLIYAHFPQFVFGTKKMRCKAFGTLQVCAKFLCEFISKGFGLNKVCLSTSLTQSIKKQMSQKVSQKRLKVGENIYYMHLRINSY